MTPHKLHTRSLLKNIVYATLFIAGMYWLTSCKKEKIEPSKPKDCGQCRIYPVYGKPVKEIDKSATD